MELKTHARPGDIQSLEDFINRVANYDWYTDMSDDNRVYLRGRRAQELVDEYAKQHPAAAQVWKLAKKDHLMHFYAGQLMTRIGAVVLAPSTGDLIDANDALRKFCIGYLAGANNDCSLVGWMRDRISHEVEDCPKSYQFERRAERETMITEWIENWTKTQGA